MDYTRPKIVREQLRFIPKKERERMAAEKAAKEEKRKKEEEELKKEEEFKKEKEEFKKEKEGWEKKKEYRKMGIKELEEAIADKKRALEIAAMGTNGADGNPNKRARHDASTGPKAISYGYDIEAYERQVMEQNKATMLRVEAEREARRQSKFSAAKKRQRREANKFNFDWDPADDTSIPLDPVTHAYELLSPDGKARQKAEWMRSGDPETGEERAKKFLEDYERGKKERHRREFGKHWSEMTLEEMTQRDWRIFKENFAITTKGGAIPNPMRSWEESNLPRRLLDIVHQVGYDKPTPIQKAAIPIALQARDLIGVAVTGSGKTAAFLLPLLVYISELPPLSEDNKHDGPYALILAPTRELAQQIESEARKFAGPLGFTVVSIVGGHSMEEQAFSLSNGAEIIVATPGRLVDCLERRLLVLSQCCYIIMDEADRMIDQGFEVPLTKILDALPVTNEKPDTADAENPQMMTRYLGGKDRYRQTMMYTATMPPLVEKIAKKYLRRPAIVTIGNTGEAVDTVEQRVEFISGEDKRKRRLQEILNSHQFKPPIIVFVNIRVNCELVAREIKSWGYSTATLHGSKTQEQREASLASVRNGQTDVLVATDLAGRGIDVLDVSLVVNFNMALSIESYTHRIGRTGRAGKKGVAITFLGNEDSDVMYDLKQIISKSPISKLPDELRTHEAAQSKPARAKKGGFGGKGGSWQ